METKGADKMPAPNAYDADAKNIVMSSAPSFGFGSSKRPFSQDTRGVPGPGTYNSITLPDAASQGKSIAKRYPEAKTSNQFTPGPGTYPITNYNQTSAPNTKIGKSSRDVEKNFRKKFANYPSPDRYNPQRKFIAASFSFGTGQRHSLS
jgi:hypothetical protein